MSGFVKMLTLYMLIRISGTQLDDQFDKVCKKKFLVYLDEDNGKREVSREERDAARENMEKFIYRQEADNMRGGRRHQKIISDNMIAVFMTFLTYGQTKRRNFLLNDVSIEEAFDDEVKFRP